MSFVSCVGIELQKIRRSKILWLLWIPAVLLWLPALLNLNGNFAAQAEGMALADNYRIQGFLAMTWFMYPACMVVCTVLLSQLERSNRGMVKMLTLPVNPAKWSAAKFVVLLLLAAAQVAASGRPALRVRRPRRDLARDDPDPVPRDVPRPARAVARR